MSTATDIDQGLLKHLPRVSALPAVVRGSFHLPKNFCIFVPENRGKTPRNLSLCRPSQQAPPIARTVLAVNIAKMSLSVPGGCSLRYPCVLERD